MVSAMSGRNDLFTIGEFSKITGMGIHSLRYYDEIGALKPEYVDPVSSYRYYSVDQLGRIPGINICLSSGIRLTDFDRFMDEGSVNYSKLISESRMAIDRKIDEYRRQKEDLLTIEQLLSIGKAGSSDDCCRVLSGGYDVWTMPYEDDSVSGDAHDFLVRLSSHARKRGCQISPVCFGLLRTGSGDDAKPYAFSYIQEISDSEAAEPNIFHIPKGHYLLRSSDGCSLKEAGELSRSISSGGSGPLVMSFIMIGGSSGDLLYFVSAGCD